MFDVTEEKYCEDSPRYTTSIEKVILYGVGDVTEVSRLFNVNVKKLK